MKLFSSRETAERLNITRASVYNYAKRYKLGHKVKDTPQGEVKEFTKEDVLFIKNIIVSRTLSPRIKSHYSEIMHSYHSLTM